MTTMILAVFSIHVFALAQWSLASSPMHVEGAVCYHSTSKTFFWAPSSMDCDDQGAVASVTVSVNNSYLHTGWDDVRIVGTTATPPAIEYYAAGFGEGYTTFQKTFDSYVNIVLPGLANTTQWGFLAWILEHIEYLETFTVEDQDPFRSQVALFMRMVHGLADGYNAQWIEHGSPANMNLTFFEIFLLNFQPEIVDVQSATDGVARWAAAPLPKGLVDRVTLTHADTRRRADEAQVASISTPPNILSRFSHCSALIRNSGDDLFVAHASWTTYASMLRQFKTYDLSGDVVSMSGYPGFISSTDDWYMTSKQLAVTETTNGVFNNTLFQLYTIPNSISEFLRVMSANVLANSGAAWAAHFATNNSGTYCNQYMVVDMKLYVPGQDIAANTLWVSEQLPGYVESADVSAVLQSQGYWASYNIPYFQKVSDMSENDVMVDLYGSVWSYNNYSRAEIFRRDAPKVQSLEDMQHIMRYSNYTLDPFSLIPNCTGAVNDTCTPVFSPWLTVASRGDLAPFLASTAEYTNAFGYQYDQYVPMAFGAIDAKITSFSMMRDGTLSGALESGPTHDNLPPFKWSSSGFASQKPLGQPDEFNFEFETYSYSLSSPTESTIRAREWVTTRTLFCGAALLVIIVSSLTWAKFRPSQTAANKYLLAQQVV